MKTKSMVRRGSSRSMLWGMLGIVATLLLAVGLVFSTGTRTSAKAADPEVYATVDGVNLYVVSFDSAESVSEPFSPYSYSKDVSKAYLCNNITMDTTREGISLSSTHQSWINGECATLRISKSSVWDIPGYVFSGKIAVVDRLLQYFNPMGCPMPYVSDDAFYIWGQMFSVLFLPTNTVFSSLPFMLIYEPAPLPLPETPTKEGHHFVGWYYDNAFTQPYDNAPIYADTQLYAKFEINTYTVTYDTGYGTAVSPATVNWNTTAPTPETTRTGYNFTGWLLPDGTQYTNQSITQDTTLTAKWEVKKFTVTFYVDGEVYKALEVEYGTVLQNAMTKAKVASYQPFDSSGARLSRYASTITEDTNVLLHELTGWEKYGDFVGRSPWYTWLMVGIGGALALAFSICVVLLVKWRK